MRSFVVIALVALTAGTTAADVRRDQARYTAFELEAGTLAVGALPDGTTAVGGQVGTCKAALADNVLTIAEATSSNPACQALFDSDRPGAMSVDLVVKKVTTTFVIPFDHGISGVATAEYDPKDHGISLQPPATGMLVFHSQKGRHWDHRKVGSGRATLDDDEITPGSLLYFQPDGASEVFEVTWTVKPPAGAAAHQDEPGRSCDIAIEQARNYDWSTIIDSENPTDALVVVVHPSTRPLVTIQTTTHNPFPELRWGARGAVPSAVVEPNSFGFVVVRHKDSLVPTFDSDFTRVALFRAGHDPGLGQQGIDRVPASEGARVAAVKPHYVCTTHQVLPHKPGAFQVKLKLTDPTKTDATVRVVSERNVDVLVLERYVGAFRTGVAILYGAPDRDFGSRTAAGASQAELVETKATPVELVVGYSVFLSSFRGKGRSHFDNRGRAKQDSRLGLFLGFGAVSFAATDVTFLKSLHVGLEYELGPHLSIAVTGVLRRVDSLEIGELGGPAPTTIATKSTYEPALGLVVNISPSFFKFARTIGQ